MYSIIFKEKFYKILYNFLKSYRDVFKKLYSDTWIPNEHLLFQTYVESSDKIEEEIIDKIENYLQEKVIWYRLYETWEKSIKIFLKSFMLEVYFEEDEKEKIRFIEKILINKK